MKRPVVKGVTIDDVRTRDMDDAIWVDRHENGWIVYVSISDVAHYVQKDSDADLRAREVTATQYYRQGSDPMLSRELAERKLSLWTRPKATLTIEFGVDFEGVRSPSKVYHSICTSSARLSYSQIPVIQGDPTHELHRMVQEALNLSQLLLQKRRKAGALLLYDVLTGWVLTEEGYLRQLTKREDTVGYILVQEMMIAANEAIALFAAENGIPMLFRNHVAIQAAPPREELLERITAAFTTPLPNLELERQKLQIVLGKASYDPILRGHYGLNLPAYTHFTSPIRRYADLIGHRQIKAHLQQEKYPYSIQDLQKEGAHINARTLEILAARSSYAKAKAEARAQSIQDNEEKLNNLNPKDFERVCKVQARQGGDPSEAFVESFFNRLSTGKLPPICNTVVMVEAPETDAWRPLKEGVFQGFVQKPNEVPTFLTQASAIYGWPEANFDIEWSGPGHALRFQARARIDLQGRGRIETAWVPGKSSDHATRRASVVLLALIYGFDPPIYEEDAPPAPKPKVEPENAISALFEHCQSSGLAAPQYEYLREGPDHQPIFVCTCKVGEKAAKGKGATKQGAKEDSSKQWLLQR